MSKHPLAGGTVTLLIDGEEEEYQLEEGISEQEGEAFINSMLGVDASEPPTEVDHPELEFTDSPIREEELVGFRTLCRLDCCDKTEVFDSMQAIKDSGWTELEWGIGVLTDMTDLHHGYCPGHSLGETAGNGEGCP
jgi:hypothetical protein